MDARDKLLGSKPTDSDGVLALRLADYLTEGMGERLHLMILGGPEIKTTLPLTCRRPRKRTLEYTATNRQAAIGWIVQAALEGHGVLRRFGDLDTGAGGAGTLAEFRERCGERAQAT